MKEELQSYISNELLSGEHNVGFDEDLLLQGLVDSVGLMRLVEHIEGKIGIKVPPQEFTIENFGTINALSNYLTAKAENAATDSAGSGYG